MKWCSTSVRRTTVPIAAMGHSNCNDQIAARAFGASMHIDPVDLSSLMTYDAIFATMPKIRESWESRWMDSVHHLCDAGKKVVLFQEAETVWPMTRSWEEIQSFVQLLGKVDLFLTHNIRDVNLWGELRKGKVTFRWRTCLDLELASKHRINPELKVSRPLLFGASYDGRANGLTGLIACKDLGRPLWHQNRSTGYEDRNRGIPELLGVMIDKEIPHTSWESWLAGISGAYIAVNMMTAPSAGRDQIAFAALGIPCIGNADLDIQNELFPGLAVDPFNVPMIRRCVTCLLENLETYEAIRNLAIQKVVDYGLAFAKYQADLMKTSMGWES